MKKYLKGFIPAYQVENFFMLDLVDKLREQRIDSLLDTYQESGKDPEVRVQIVQQIRNLRTNTPVMQGEVDGFTIRHHNGYYWIKKDPRVQRVVNDDYTFQEKRMYLWKYHVLNSFVECTDEPYERNIHRTIKIPNGMTVPEVIADLREYSDSRCSHSPYDCSGAEIGCAYALPQVKKGELRIVDCIRYDY